MRFFGPLKTQIQMTSALSALSDPMGKAAAIAALVAAGFAQPSPAGAVTYSPLTAPTGLSYTPPFVVSGGSDGTYKHDYDPASNKPVATHTVYVDWRVADNSGDGLTWATRVRSLNMGMTKANALGTGSSKPRILAYPGEYLYSNQDGSGVPDSFAGKSCTRTTLIVEACDNSGNPSNDSGKIISVHNTILPAFVATSDANVWVSTYTTELVAKTSWDKTKLDTKGNPIGVPNVPDALNGNVSGIISAINALNTLWGRGAFYIDTAAKKVYVRTWNGRQPDANLFFGRGTTNGNDVNSRNFYLNGIYGNVTTVWARGLWTYGGCGMYGTTYMPDSSPSGVFKGWDCGTNYSSQCGIAWDGNFTSTLYRHTADYNYKDGYNYDQSTGLDPSGTAVMRFHELDSTGDWNGWDNNGDGSNNGSSAHFRAIGVRVNCTYDRTANRAIHDIIAAKSWNLGLTASNCRQTGLQSGAFVIGFLPNTGETAQMWLDGCKSINNQYDIESYKGASLYYRNLTPATPVTDAQGGSISTY